MVSGSAHAADMAEKAVKAPPSSLSIHGISPSAAAIMNNYVFRGITQSNHKASVAAYFEPRYNITKDVQLYAGVSGESISFPNRAAAEIDIYVGIRPTFGPLAFDFGFWYYGYPGGKCYYGTAGPAGQRSLPNGNVTKKDGSFYEVTPR